MSAEGPRWVEDLSDNGQVTLLNAIENYLATDQLQDYAPYAKQAMFHAAGKGFQHRMIKAGNQALANDTPILTPQGFRAMGSLRVGEFVYGLSGHPVKILAVHPQGVQQAYRVTARDGASVVADTGHLWLVRHNARHPWVVRTTGEMFARMQRKRGSANPYQLPLRPMLDFGDLPPGPVDARLLGILLGDGCLSRQALEFVSADTELVEYVRLRAAEWGCNVVHYASTREGDVDTYGITSPGGPTKNKLKDALRELGVMGCNAHSKCVPEPYKFGPAPQRQELLSGLFDTDGCAERNGRRIFVSVSRQLAEDVLFMIRSLGMNASVSLVNRKVDGVPRPIYRVHAHNGPLSLFGLTRKRVRENRAKRAVKFMYITSIEEVPAQPTTCITIDSHDHVFLAGEGLVPTRNTGKSHCGGAETAFHLTGEYPDWWNGFRFNRPITAWAAGVTADAVRDNPQRVLLGQSGREGTGLIPKRCLTGMAGRSKVTANLYDFIHIKHVSGGTSMLRFRYYAQDREAWQGPPVHWLWLDEEPPIDMYLEGIARLTAVKGRSIMTYTPIKGRSQVTLLYIDDDQRGPTRHVTTMTLYEAGHMTEDEVEIKKGEYPEHEIAARIYGEPSAGEGAVFPIAEERIIVEDFEIPDHWPVIGGLDFGWTHPTAAVKMAIDIQRDAYYIIAEYRKDKEVPQIHALTLKAWGQYLRWAWPKDGSGERGATGEQFVELFHAEGMRMLPEHAKFLPTAAAKQRGQSVVSVERGVQEILQRMRTERFKVFASCRGLLNEIRMYHRIDGKIVEREDDTIDAMRYAVMMSRYAEPHRAARLPPSPQIDWRGF